MIDPSKLIDEVIRGKSLVKANGHHPSRITMGKETIACITLHCANRQYATFYADFIREFLGMKIFIDESMKPGEFKIQ